MKKATLVTIGLIISVLSIAQIPYTLQSIITDDLEYDSSILSNRRYPSIEHIKFDVKGGVSKLREVYYFPAEGTSEEDMISGNITKWRKEVFVVYGRERIGDGLNGQTVCFSKCKDRPNIILKSVFDFKDMSMFLEYRDTEKDTYVKIRYELGNLEFEYTLLDELDDFDEE